MLLPTTSLHSFVAVVSLTFLNPSIARAQGSPAQVTTDTAQYCLVLAAKMDREVDASFDAIALGAQGKDLCAKGEIRAGIARLRRALLAARDDDDGEDDVTVSEPVPSTSGSSSQAQTPAAVGSDATDDGTSFFSTPPNLGGAGGGPPGGGPGGGPGGRGGPPGRP